LIVQKEILGIICIIVCLFGYISATRVYNWKINDGY